MRTKIIIGLVIAVVIVVGAIFYAGTLSAPEDRENVATFSEKDIIGAWTFDLSNPNDPGCKKAQPDEVCFPNDSEEIDFVVADGVRVFSSFLHSQPNHVSCSWNLEKNSVSIYCPDEGVPGLSFSYNILAISSTTLTLSEESKGGGQIWRRVHSQGAVD